MFIQSMTPCKRSFVSIAVDKLELPTVWIGIECQKCQKYSSFDKKVDAFVNLGHQIGIFKREYVYLLWSR